MSVALSNYDVLEMLKPPDGVRNLEPWEFIPEALELGFEQLGKIDYNWVWVLVDKGQIKGAILAAPCHGTAFIWRVAVLPGLPNTAIVRLLRGFLASMRKRGVKGLLTIVDPEIATQRRLKRVLQRIRGREFGTYELIVTPMPKEVV